MDGANAFGATSSNNYGGTISKYYDRNEDKKNKGDKKEKEKEIEKEKKEESDSDEEDSESEEEKERIAELKEELKNLDKKEL